MPSDAHRDSQMLDWILARKNVDEESTLEDFNDLMKSKFNERVAQGGLTNVHAYEARSTGFAKTLDTREKKLELIKAGDEDQLKQLKQFAETHGAEKLDELEPEQLYDMYQAHTASLKVAK